jgi:WD40 repeat protein
MEGHTSIVVVQTVSPDGKLLASGSFEGAIKLWSLPQADFASCLMDPAANEETVEGVTYEFVTESGQTIQHTLPCGAPIPAGAVCVCDCVAGSAPSCSCVGHLSHYWYPN